MSAWTRSVEGGEWGDKVGRMMKADSVERFASRPADVPSMFLSEQAPVRPGPIGYLAEERIKAFDSIDVFEGEFVVVKV